MAKSHMDDPVVKALGDELSRVYERLRSPSTTSVGQYTAIVLASGLLAAARYPEAFVVVPVFWTAWMLHALVLDLDSVKLAVYARWLERQANRELGRQVFVWESDLADRGRVNRPIAYPASVCWWALMNIAAWTIAIVIFLKAERTLLAAVLIAAAFGAHGVAVWTLHERRRYSDGWESLVQRDPPAAVG